MGRATDSWASSDATRRVMQANRSRDTRPEKDLRRALNRMRLRYRVSARPLAGLRRTADIVFGPVKVAVFVDGCFWHGCPDHRAIPKSNIAFWTTKLKRNAVRDRETDEALVTEGWLVIRVWEHEDPLEAAVRIAEVVSKRRALSVTRGRGT